MGLNVVSTLKLFGYSIQKEASELINRELSSINRAEHDQWYEDLVESIQRQSLETNVLNSKAVSLALKELGKDVTANVQVETNEDEPILTVVDSFETPRFTYNEETAKYDKSNGEALLGGIDSKINVFRERYMAVWQRTVRHEMFTPAHRKAQSAQFSLQKIEYLKGISLKMTECVILGMLTQMKEGEWWIEDPTGALKLNLAEASFHKGIFVESSFVLVQGTFEDGILNVTAFGFPPTEPASKTRAHFGQVNFFGGKRTTNVGSSERLSHLEMKSENSLCILSDVYLDNKLTFTRLMKLIDGFKVAPPMAFILCGDFLERPHDRDAFEVLKKSLDKLAKKIIEADMKQSVFIFVPGPNDPGLADCLPRPAIPEALISPFIKQRLPNWRFVSNPARLTLFSQEVVIFRSNMTSRLMRHAIREPSETDLAEMSVRTILSQSHLAPFPQRISPIYWGWDHALRLFPLPDLLIMADNYKGYNLTLSGTLCINPSSFSRNGNFNLYYPKERSVDDSQVD